MVVVAKITERDYEIVGRFSPHPGVLTATYMCANDLFISNPAAPATITREGLPVLLVGRDALLLRNGSH